MERETEIETVTGRDRGREKERERERKRRDGQVDKYMYKGQVVDLKSCRQTGRGGREKGKLCR